MDGKEACVVCYLLRTMDCYDNVPLGWKDMTDERAGEKIYRQVQHCIYSDGCPRQGIYTIQE